MSAVDRVADQHAAAQLAASNIHLTAELERTRHRLDQCVEATGRALAAAQRGNAVAQAEIQYRAAIIRFDKQGDTPVTRTVVTVARGNLDHALKQWTEGTK